MEESAIISTSMIRRTVTELKHTVMEKYIEESSKITTMTVMDSRSIGTKMSMTVNGRMAGNTDLECSRRHQLEELKEDFIKGIKSKKSLK